MIPANRAQVAKATVYIALAALLAAAMVWANRLMEKGRVIANPTLSVERWTVGEPPLQNILALEMAKTPEEQRRGLMARDNVGQYNGMAFPKDGKTPAGFWMRGMRIPLDIVYVDASGRVDKVVRGKPGDETPLGASRPTSLVIEVPAGRARLYGLVPGARVRRGA